MCISRRDMYLDKILPINLDFYVVPLILVDTLNAVEGAGLNVRPTNEQLQLDSKQTQSIWRIYIQMLLLKNGKG